MPEDIAINENFVSTFDEVGDIKTHRGDAAVQQAVAISVIEYTPNSAIGFTPTAIEDRRGAIDQAVRENQFTEEPIAVTVEETNQTTQTITFRVETNQLDFPIDIDA